MCSCRGGITANILSVQFASLGAKDISLYDGSWAEWSKYEDNPIERGPAK
jgi:thiosulfate/3-mercaptopyruvate sulfurtransferase